MEFLENLASFLSGPFLKLVGPFSDVSTLSSVLVCHTARAPPRPMNRQICRASRLNCFDPQFDSFLSFCPDNALIYCRGWLSAGLEHFSMVSAVQFLSVPADGWTTSARLQLGLVKISKSQNKVFGQTKIHSMVGRGDLASAKLRPRYCSRCQAWLYHGHGVCPYPHWPTFLLFLSVWSRRVLPHA